MEKIFCKSEGLGVEAKLLIAAAATAIAKNNLEFAKKALPVAKDVLSVIEKGINNDALNIQLKEMIKVVVAKASDDPIIVAAVNLALLELGIDINVEFPAFENKKIKDMAAAFITGVEAVTG